MSCLCPREAHDQELTDAKVIMGLRGSFPEPYFCTLGYKKFPLIGIFALVSGQKSSEIDFWNLLVISTVPHFWSLERSFIYTCDSDCREVGCLHKVCIAQERIAEHWDVKISRRNYHLYRLPWPNVRNRRHILSRQKRRLSFLVSWSNSLFIVSMMTSRRFHVELYASALS